MRGLPVVSCITRVILRVAVSVQVLYDILSCFFLLGYINREPGRIHKSVTLENTFYVRLFVHV
jgi:hypothetical protein